MKKVVIAASLLVAACGPSATTTATATNSGPQGVLERTLAQAPEMQPVAATQALTAYQNAHPEATPKCTEIREAAVRGRIPADVAEGSIYQPFAGDLVFAIQCGPRLTTVAPDPHQHWLVVMAPGAPDVTVVNCADAHGTDRCTFTVPRGAVTSTGSATTAP